MVMSQERTRVDMAGLPNCPKCGLPVDEPKRARCMYCGAHLPEDLCLEALGALERQALPKRTRAPRRAIVAALVVLVLTAGFVIAGPHFLKVSPSPVLPDLSETKIRDSGFPPRITGSIFVKLIVGTDLLAGTNVRLVRARPFAPEFESILADAEAARIAWGITRTSRERSAVKARLQKHELMKRAKTEELAACQRERWSTFEYKDPLTGKEQTLEYYETVSRTNSKTLVHMATRLRALESEIAKVAAEESQLATKQRRECERLRRAAPKSFAGRRTQLPAGTTEGTEALKLAWELVAEARSAEELELRHASAVVRAVDRHTADLVRANELGQFTFAPMPRDEYIVYASFHTHTWLVPVEWEPGSGLPGRARRVLLAGQASLNQRDLVERDRTVHLARILSSVRGLAP